MTFDISELPKTGKDEIADMIREDNLEIVNQIVEDAVPRNTAYTKYLKRVIDVAVSLPAVVVTAPVNGAIAVITLFDVGSPIIFKQKRIGLNGKQFFIYKFRNMTNEMDRNGELLPPDQRVTKWGHVVRRTSLDELLNFVSILRGDMSLIGPRPLLDSYEGRMNKRHKALYSVRPGLECPPLGKIDHPIGWEEKLDHYVWYAENCSFAVDLKLFARLIQLAFDRKSTKIRASAQNGAFLGYDAAGHVITSKCVPEKYVDEYCRRHGFSDLEEAIASRGHAQV